MRSFLKILCSLIFLSGKLIAQNYDHAVVKISQTPVDITTLAKTIATQTGLEYSLNMQNASLQKRISLKKGKWELADILKEVQQQAGLNYRVIGDHILFMDYIVGVKTKPAPVKKIIPVIVKKPVLQPVVIAPLYTAKADNLIVAVPALYLKPRLKTPVKLITPVEEDKEENKWYIPFSRGGISSDEILYANISLMAGIKYVYGIASVGTGFKGNRFRWGAGIPVKINEDQQFHLTFTTGQYKRTDGSGSDTTSYLITPIKETLNRYGIAWSKTYNEKWMIQAQVHYNTLKRATDSAFQGHFEYGNVPYTLSKSYGKESWIGLQLSVFYKIF
jgi:hypothetical protein